MRNIDHIEASSSPMNGAMIYMNKIANENVGSLQCFIQLLFITHTLHYAHVFSRLIVD